MKGSQKVPALPEALWELLSDPEKLGRALPGVDGVTKLDGTSCRAIVRAETRLGVTTFELEVSLTDSSRPERARIEAHGRSGEQRVDAVCDLILAESDGGSEVGWEADVRFAGGLSSLGQQVLAGLVRQHIEGAIGAAGQMVA